MVELRAQYRGIPASVRIARSAVVDYARACGFPSKAIVDIALGVGEALANAVEHGSSDGTIRVSCSFTGSILTIEIRDDGRGFDVHGVTSRVREPDSVRGFGISIMRSVMDHVEFVGHGSVVRLSKRAPASSVPRLGEKMGA